MKPPKQSNYELAPEGTHPAICVEVIDLGTQPQTFQGQPKAPARMVRFAWQLIHETQSDGRPFTIGNDYAFSMGKKANFRKMLESWIPKSVMDAAGGVENFDIKDLINKGCLVTIAHRTSGTGNEYANVTGVTSLAKGMQKPTPVADPLYFSLERDEYNKADFDRLPDWLRDKVKASPEWAELQAPKPTRQNGGMSDHDIDRREMHTADLDDEIPF